MRLSELADLGHVHGAADPEITGVRHDSRTVSPGDIFVAVRGSRFDGHDFVGEAVERGASAVVIDHLTDAPGVPSLLVEDTRSALTDISLRVYDRPSEKLCLIGVTGTNGKTTTAYLTKTLLQALGHPTGLIGTVEAQIGNRVIHSERTTPEASDINRLLAEMVRSGITHAVMEVSSHALTFGRVRGLRFQGAVFTNLTQDHLDFHGSMDEYAKSKARLFAMLEPQAWASLNADDPMHRMMMEACRANKVLFGIDSDADFRALDPRVESTGLSFTILGPSIREKVRSSLTGRFNVSNILGGLSLLASMGYDLETMIHLLRDIRGVPGRFEQIETRAPFTVIVDYAHTPDGLANALGAARDVTRGRVIVVIGCGGDRDRAKRPIMGKVATTESDMAFLTSDNPRSEDPLAILKEMETGARQGTSPYKIVADRRAAIEAAINAARAGDIVLIAGKGHETYQIIGDREIPFDDRAVAQEVLSGS